MRMSGFLRGPFCLCALFLASLWASEGVGWTETRKTVDALDWHHAVAPGQTVSIQNLNGPITVTAASGAEAEVRARVSYKESNPSDIKFDVKTDDKGAHVCALWPGMDKCRGSVKGPENRNDLVVEFEVRLPSGVLLETVSVNGDVEVHGATAAVTATTVNGNVRVETRGGPLRAETVNGGIEVRVAQLAQGGEVKLSTVNGDINARLSPRLDAEVSARTVSGQISVFGKAYQDRVRTTVGRGGGRVIAENVNGSIAIEE